MKYLVALLLSLIPINNAIAGDYGFLDLQELSIDYKNYYWLSTASRNPLIYPEIPKEGINININTNFLQHFYFNSTVESLTTAHQYRGIGLQFNLGMRLTDDIDFGYWHHSQHTIDRQISTMSNYPVEDAVQIKFYLYRAKPGKDGIF